MNTHAVQAKLLLRHYLSLAVGSSYNGDDASQINSIVDHIIAAVVEELQAQPSPALVQPSMFPSGEAAPLFTLPEDAPAMVMFPDGEYHELPAPEDAPGEPCVGCGRKPEESGREEWETCFACGRPFCENCEWSDGQHHYCSENCLHAATDYL